MEGQADAKAQAPDVIDETDYGGQQYADQKIGVGKTAKEPPAKHDQGKDDTAAADGGPPVRTAPVGDVDNAEPGGEAEVEEFGGKQ